METEKKDVINRLRTVGGHLKAVERMIEEEKDCEEILHQLHALSASLQKVREKILLRYMDQCMGKEEKQDAEELIKLFKMTWK